MKRLLTAISVLLFSSLSWGHTRFLPNGVFQARSTNPGLKTGPCGNIAKGTPQITLNTGQTITVQWEETINHPGYFEFSISADNDQTFVLLATVQDNQNTGPTPHPFQANITLPPGLQCASCTLQMIQQMTEDPNNPRPYFSCVDIEITNLGTDTSTDPVNPQTPSPATPPAEECHD